MYVIIFTAHDDLGAYGPYPTYEDALAALCAWHVRTEVDSDPDADPIALAQAPLEDIQAAYTAGTDDYHLDISSLIYL